jgi:hypothetical protein
MISFNSIINDFNHAIKHDSNGKHVEWNIKKLVTKYLIEDAMLASDVHS